LTLTIVLAVLALIVGLSFGVAAFTLALAVMVNEVSKRQLETVKSELRAENGLRKLAETERDGLKAAIETQARAIESSALPWFPKTEKMEQRYENEAIDRMENPSFYDSVDGLGSTR